MLYQYTDYKSYLSDLIQKNKEQKGYRTRLAEGAGCQKSFLSQVLNGHVHLTPEHGAAIGAFLNFDEQEADYFLALVDYARAGTEHLRTLIRTRLETHRRRHDDISHRWARDEIKGVEAEAIYYSSWYIAAIHVLVSITGFNTVKQISLRLGLQEEVTQQALHQLHRLGLARNTGGKWTTGEKSIHLGKHALMAETYHSAWRQRAVLDCQRKREWSTHYSSVFAIAKADAEALRVQLLDFLVAVRQSLAPSPEEEIYCFNADLFRV